MLGKRDSEIKRTTTQKIKDNISFVIDVFVGPKVLEYFEDELFGRKR